MKSEQLLQLLNLVEKAECSLTIKFKEKTKVQVWIIQSKSNTLIKENIDLTYPDSTIEQLDEILEFLES